MDQTCLVAPGVQTMLMTPGAHLAPRQRRSLAALAAGVTVLALAVLPSGAQASATVEVGPNSAGENAVLIQGDDGSDEVTVSTSTDPGGPIVEVTGTISQIGPGCAVVLDTFGVPEIHCQATTGTPALTETDVDLAGGADQFRGSIDDAGLGTYVDGGAGDDTLTGTTADDTLLGGPGNDFIQGNNGADSINGGEGNDTLSGEADLPNVVEDTAGDDLIGGPGRDTVFYTARDAHGVTVSLDGQANDGNPGEGDQVDPSVEILQTTEYDDVITGGPGNDTIDSKDGNDTIDGAGGDDVLRAGDGDDIVHGGSGNDTVQGGFGNDRLDGGPGVDILQGDTLERDVIAIGNDIIDARDGGTADTVDCGIGADIANVDIADTVTSDPAGLCETVNREAGPITEPPGTRAPTVSHVRQTHRIWRLGSAAATIASTRAVPVGTTFSFALNEPASVSLAFTQTISGRRAKGRCAKATHKNRRRPACKRAVAAGTLSLPGHAGPGTIGFRGRISASKRLHPGRYTLLITASVGGQRSRPHALSFTIAK